jgi:diguanylate cyclase (GGDEF)-like protein
MKVVTLDDIDRQIQSRFPLLRFQPGIEPAFIEEYTRSRLRLAPLWALIGTAMYLFMLVDDFNLTPDVFWPLLIARTCVFTPVALFGVWALKLWPKALNYDLLALWVGVVGTLLPMSIVVWSDSPYLFAYQNGNVAAFLFFVIVLRPRFPVGVVGLVLMTAIHAVTMHLSGAFDPLVFSSIVSFVVTVAVFLGAGAYFLEYTDRMNFLNRLRGQLLHTQLEQRSERDELTGLLNRQALARRRETIWAGRRDQATIAAIMLDIDRFKLFNDFNGHIAGDDCIRAVSGCISRHVGHSGIAFRFGGEEMLVLMTGADGLQALALAEKIRTAIETLGILHGGLADGQVVTASLGVACGSIADVSLEELLMMADAALYTSKRNGRNTVHVYDAARAENTDIVDQGQASDLPLAS